MMLMLVETAELREALERWFGFHTFRPSQEAIVRDVLSGRDVFALLPTGGGKSLCYQLPAVLTGRLTVVISPLIALMKDQVDALDTAGVGATALNSSLEWPELRRRLDGLERGAYKLLYVAPVEHVANDRLLRRAERGEAEPALEGLAQLRGLDSHEHHRFAVCDVTTVRQGVRP